LANFQFSSIFFNTPSSIIDENAPSITGEGCGSEFNQNLDIDYLGGEGCTCTNSTPELRVLGNGNCAMSFSSCFGASECLIIRIPCSSANTFLNDFVNLDNYECP